VKESLSECLLLAAVAEVPVRTVALPNLTVVQVVHVFVGFVQIVVNRFSQRFSNFFMLRHTKVHSEFGCGTLFMKSKNSAHSYNCEVTITV